MASAKRTFEWFCFFRFWLFSARMDSGRTSNRSLFSYEIRRRGSSGSFVPTYSFLGVSASLISDDSDCLALAFFLIDSRV